MGMGPNSDDSSERELRKRACGGYEDSWAALFDGHRDRLKRMVDLRLDRRLQGRIDPSDVIQESFLEAVHGLPDYLKQPSCSVYLWLRGIVAHKLQELHRRHLGTKMRDAGREISIYSGAFPETS